jgi:hypothetical protein
VYKKINNFQGRVMIHSRAENTEAEGYRGLALIGLAVEEIGRGWCGHDLYCDRSWYLRVMN